MSDLARQQAASPVRALVACEESARVRDALRAIGIDAWSCDLEPTRGDPRWHIQGDAIAAAYGQPWDLLIAHPPCTYLANSGAKHLYAGMNKANGPDPDRWAGMGHGAAFFLAMLNAPVPHVAVENPIMLGHPKRLFGIPDPDQVVQPWWFGEGEIKATCWWLKGLPKLVASNPVDGRVARVHRMAPGPDRQKNRSATPFGCAEAYARQWGGFLIDHIEARRLAA
jgi:hypothetical protein